MTDHPWKAAWQAAVPPARQDTTGLKPMLRQRRHPVFKKICAQLLWEAFAFAAILLLYHNLFDGARKPVYANIVLIGAGLLVLAHTLVGYLQFRRAKDAPDLRQALEMQLKRMKLYAVSSIASRSIWTASLAVFFGTAMTGRQGLFVLAFALLTLGQIAWLSRIWKSRLQALRQMIAGL